jgi:hypothetical protein
MVGRNDPCPCGSGRRYKKCHLPADSAAVAADRGDERSPLHELDNRLVEQILHFASVRFRGDFGAELEVLETHPGMSMQFAVPWLAFIATYDGRTALEWFLEERAWSLSAGAAAWLTAQQNSWLTVWEVLDVEPGRGMTLRDELTGEQRTVHEVSGSRVAVRHSMLLCRVVDHGGVSTIAGMHSVPLSPRAGLEVAERIRKTLRRKTAVPPERLRDERIAQRMLAAWSDGMDRANRPPKLTNTDGEPLLLTSDRWPVEPGGRAAVAQRLAGIEGEGRKRVEKMLQEIEMLESSFDPAERFDVSMLRTALGIGD